MLSHERVWAAIDALAEGYEVYVPVDAVGGTSLAAHDAALRRIEQAGGKLISTVQLFCELQRDWQRSDTVPAFMDLFIQTGGTARASPRSARNIGFVIILSPALPLCRGDHTDRAREGKGGQEREPAR